MAKVNLGSMFHVAYHHDPDGVHNGYYLRSAHSTGGNKAFRRCVADKIRGGGGTWRDRRNALASAAKSCAGTRRSGR